MTVGDPPRWPRDTPLSTKVDTKFRRQVAVAQSVSFAWGLKATEFVLFCAYKTTVTQKVSILEIVYSECNKWSTLSIDHAEHSETEVQTYESGFKGGLRYSYPLKNLRPLK
jgi:hypothetical protein